MRMHFVARFEPLPSLEDEFCEALKRMAEISRTDAGCLGIRLRPLDESELDEVGRSIVAVFPRPFNPVILEVVKRMLIR